MKSWVFRVCRNQLRHGQCLFDIVISLPDMRGFLIPALSYEPGQIPAQEAKCPSVSKASTVGPISAKTVAAQISLTPGIV